MPLRGRSVLVVEDEDAVRVLVAELLVGAGYRVAVADNGYEALLQLEADLPELILLDMRMPVLDGWGFASALAQRGLNIPIIVFTAAEDAQARAREVGAMGWLSKPFEIRDLFDAVKKALGDSLQEPK